MNYLSVCSGIEATSVAWHGLGWVPLAFSEIEPFPSAVLKHHFPRVPNVGDMTKFKEWPEKFLVDLADADLLVGGTPCQAFSWAGLRKSLKDARGNLSLIYIKLLDYIDEKRNATGRPAAVCVWENVPGVLSTSDNAFGCFLGGLAGSDGPLEPPDPERGWEDAGYVHGPKRTIAWRCLDAQYLGLAQRRHRVFVVASAREGFDPGAVLFESEGLRRDTPPSREAGEGIAPTVRAGAANGGTGHGARSGDSKDELIVPVVAGTLDTGRTGRTGGQGGGGGIDGLIPQVVGTLTDGAHNGGGGSTVRTLTPDGSSLARCLSTKNQRLDAESETFLIMHDTTHTLKGEGHDGSEDGTGRGVPLIAVGVDSYNGALTGDVAATLGTQSGDGISSGPSVLQPMAFDWQSGGDSRGLEPKPTAQLQRCQVPAVMVKMAVRRLTPIECERLQGFPDHWTQIPYRGKPSTNCPDGPRYKAIGNSMAVPVMAWIGQRIARHLKL